MNRTTNKRWCSGGLCLWSHVPQKYRTTHKGLIAELDQILTKLGTLFQTAGVQGVYELRVDTSRETTQCRPYTGLIVQSKYKNYIVFYVQEELVSRQAFIFWIDLGNQPRRDDVLARLADALPMWLERNVRKPIATGKSSGSP